MLVGILTLYSWIQVLLVDIVQWGLCCPGLLGVLRVDAGLYTPVALVYPSMPFVLLLIKYFVVVAL